MLNRRLQRGLSIVEMMVGVTIGLFIVAAATLVVSSQLSSNRRLLLDTQLQQDMRAASDVIARDLRRAAAMLDLQARLAVWYPNLSSPTNVQLANFTPVSVSGTTLTYVYGRRTTGANETFGFTLNGNTIRTLVNPNNWQDLTDPNVIHVTAMSITANPGPERVLPCPSPCPGPDPEACWPISRVLEYTVELQAEAANDPTIRRSMRSTVRVANNIIANRSGSATGICPP